MLYSVAICDILLKLHELSNMYNDTLAESILKEIEKSRNSSDNKSKSKWERELIDTIHQRTELLDLESYTNLLHLYDYRNFSAHPALNENYELIAPSQETTIALIKNTLSSVLIKPPIFIKKVVSMLTDDLKENHDIYKDYSKKEDLRIYLQNKYFSRMTLSMRCETFKTMWKLCFRAPDEDCKENVVINRRATEILIDGFEKEITEYIRNEPQSFEVSSDRVCLIQLASFLSRNKYLYQELSNDTKTKLDNLIEKDDGIKAISWFKYSTIEEHLDYLNSISRLNINGAIYNLLLEYYTSNGLKTQLLDYYIQLYGKSENFATAYSLFNLIIEPHLEKMGFEQIVRVIEVSNRNDQIYNRFRSDQANTTIVRKTIKTLGYDFDFSKYPNFKFDENILKYDDEKAKSEENANDDIDDELPF